MQRNKDMINENNVKLKKACRSFVFLILLFCFSNTLTAQEQKISFWSPSPVYNKKRVKLLTYSLGGAYVVSMTGLYQLWYKDYPLNRFHFFDDKNEWMQMDKSGHFGSAYYVGKWGISLFDWTGMNHKKAIWIGGSLGFAFLTSIEVFDGFSQAWGWSWADCAANVAGSALLLSQQLVWDEQRILLKFSFHETKFAQYRSDQFGKNFQQHLFKDYNGQTYWLSANIKSFLPRSVGAKFPKWLNFSFGYGAEGMTGANANVLEFQSNSVPPFERYRQFYFAPDIDLTRIKTKSKFLNSIFGAFGFVKFPLPAIEFNRVDHVKFHAFYF